MGTFTYRAKDNNGELIQGTMEADAANSVVQRLQTMGYYPFEVVDSTPKKAFTLFKRKVSIGDMTVFTRQLSDLLDAGVSLVKALTIIEKQTGNETLHEVVRQVRIDVEKGDSLEKAFAQHPQQFPTIYTAMVKAGESGGLLPEVLNRLAEFSEAENEMKSKIKSSMAYPIIMLIFGFLVIIVLMTVVIPKITKIYIELGQALPLITEVLVAVSNFTLDYFFVLSGIFIGSIILFRQYMKTKKGRFKIHTILLKIPVLGSLITKREVARFARTLGSLLRNGVNILPALGIVSDVVGNSVVQKEIASMPEQVTQGTSLANTLNESKVFPEVVVNMMAVGEETGRLDEVLIKVAKSYEAEVDRNIKTATSLIEPIIIMVMGLFVGFIVMAILIPIFMIDLGG